MQRQTPTLRQAYERLGVQIQETEDGVMDVHVRVELPDSIRAEDVQRLEIGVKNAVYAAVVQVAATSDAIRERRENAPPPDDSPIYMCDSCGERIDADEDGMVETEQGYDYCMDCWRDDKVGDDGLPRNRV